MSELLKIDTLTSRDRADFSRLETHGPTAIGAVLALHVSLSPEKIPAYRGENLYKGNMAAIDKEVPQQIFTVSVIVSAIFCRLHGREFAPPQPSYSYIENILHMMRFVEPGTGKPDPRVWVTSAIFPCPNLNVRPLLVWGIRLTTCRLSSCSVAP